MTKPSPALSILCMRMLWSIVSNVLLKSRKTTTVDIPYLSLSEVHPVVRLMPHYSMINVDLFVMKTFC